MTQKEYEDLREKEGRLERSAGIERYERLEKAAHTVNAMAAIVMALMFLGSFFFFLNYKATLMSAIWLFIGGCIIGVVGEAASRTMEALAQHMKDDYITRKCMERLVSRLDRSGAQK